MTTATHQLTHAPEPTTDRPQPQTVDRPARAPDPASAVQRAWVAPGSLSAGDVLQLQRAIGNRAVNRLLVQAKLVVTPAGDRYEQEADRIARQVAQRASVPAPRPKDEGRLQLQRTAVGVQRRVDASAGLAVDAGVEGAIQSARHGGRPLPTSLRGSMEQSFGADFSGVKVHTGAQADRLNRSLSARAFTTGRDIFFRQGEYRPGSSGGRQIIAHELTHVVQQNQGTIARDTIQRAVGFEFEILVAADLNGQDAPEKITHYQEDGMKITIDHGGQDILNMTQYIKEKAEEESSTGQSPTGVYHSIIEIVTPPSDILTDRDRAKALRYVETAGQWAMKLHEGTKELNVRVPLENIFPGASKTVSVGADVARYNAPQGQTTDAHIQSSVGIDLAAIPKFFKYNERGKLFRNTVQQPKIFTKGGFFNEALAEAVQIGATVMQTLRTNIVKQPGLNRRMKEEGQGLINLEGLVTTMGLYLWVGGFADPELATSTWKNFTPLLARNNLSEVFKKSLTPFERQVARFTKKKLLEESGRQAEDRLLSSRDKIGQTAVPSCEQFIDNVFTRDTDGVIDILVAEEAFTPLRPESVGGFRDPDELTPTDSRSLPGDRRRQGAVFELRVLKHKLSQTGRFPVDSWYPVAQEIIDLVYEVNEVKVPESGQALRLQQEWEEYMRERRNLGAEF